LKYRGDYYLEYAYAILQYVLGLGYAAIYFFEKDNLQVTQPLCLFVSLSLLTSLSLSLDLTQALEEYYKDLGDFEREFGGSVSKMTLETSRDLTSRGPLASL
jgi:hypothetical protein